jgi:hypothetical protein
MKDLVKVNSSLEISIDRASGEQRDYLRIMYLRQLVTMIKKGDSRIKLIGFKRTLKFRNQGASALKSILIRRWTNS